jgi:O-6-methylguanine DNA methyltransferase
MTTHKQQEAIEYSTFDSAIGVILTGASSRGVCLLHIGGSSPPGGEEEYTVLKSFFPKCAMVAASGNDLLARVREGILRYLDDSHPLPLLPLDIGSGTGFQQAVWTALCDIPFGQTRTYSDVAGAIGRPKASRAVGRACGRNPLAILIPCHRVVGSGGSLGGYTGGLQIKKRLLEIEAGKPFRRP